MDGWEKAEPAAGEVSETKIDAPTIIAIIAVAFAVLNISFSTGTGFGFSIGIISALMMGAGAVYTIFAVIWDVLFIGAPVLVLAAIAMRTNDWSRVRTLIIGALCFCIGLIVVDIVFGVLVRVAGLQSFSLLEMLIIYAFGSDMNLITQAVIYGGALVVFLIAMKARSSKVAIVGFSIVALLALGTLACGLQPFAYSVGGISFFGQMIPRVTTYYFSEFIAMACMWAAIVVYMVKSMPKKGKGDEDDSRSW